MQRTNNKCLKLHFTTAQHFIETDNEPTIEREHRNSEDRYRGIFRRNDCYLFIVYLNARRCDMVNNSEAGVERIVTKENDMSSYT